jgi:NAD(P)-dependent dehydrogenase (short-subunit alcohol dehydrogenase family)
VAALERGDRVAAAARRGELLRGLGGEVLPLELDVRDRAAGFAAVERAHAHFGRLDVVVNAAGYGHYGAVEEVTEEEARTIMDTNFFGALWITQAALPFLRAQGSGHIIQVSSVGGLVAGSSLGVYHASKWALEGMSTSLAAEVARWGIKVTIVEPTGFSTDAEASSRRSAPHPDYDWLLDVRAERRKLVASREGDPQATPTAILQIIDAENPPLRLLLGDGTLATVTTEYEARLASWREWEPVSRAAHGRPLPTA